MAMVGSGSSEQQRVRSIALSRRRRAQYLLNMLWDHRPGQNRFAGIVLEDLASAAETRRRTAQHLQGHPARPDGSAASLQARRLDVLDHRGRGHRVGACRDMARSRALLGPYELHPDVYILSARHRPDVALQRAGHADLVETPSGETYRSICADGRSPTAGGARSDARPRFSP